MVRGIGMVKVKEPLGDRVFNVVNYTVLCVILLAVLYPLYFVVIASFSNPDAVNAGKVIFWPVQPSLEGYARILSYTKLWVGYRNTIFYTVAGTAINVALTLTAGFALSRHKLPGMGIISALILFTMLFSGGLIPRYLLIKNMGMLNTAWAMLLPGAVSVWNLIITRTFFRYTIPEELYEAAFIDGASGVRSFLSVALPLSSAIVAVIVLWYGVEHWNAFFDAMIFLKDYDRMPLQIILRDILIATQAQDMADAGQSAFEQTRIAEYIKYGVIIVSTVPILAVYPFLQRYFVKGVMVGAIKG